MDPIETGEEVAHLTVEYIHDVLDEVGFCDCGTVDYPADLSPVLEENVPESLNETAVAPAEETFTDPATDDAFAVDETTPVSETYVDQPAVAPNMDPTQVAPEETPTDATYQDPTYQDPTQVAPGATVETDATEAVDTTTTETVTPEVDTGQMPNFDPATDSVVVGDPAFEEQFWHRQETGYTCAVVSQEFALESLSNQQLEEGDLSQLATQLGVLDTNGTTAENMDALFEYFEIPSTNTEGNTLDSLAASLEQGNKVVVSVDAQELGTPGMDYVLDEGDEAIPNTGANHAIEVIGIAQDETGQQMVVVNDPDHPEGQGMMVPISEFDDAWADGNRQMVSAGPGVAAEWAGQATA